MLGVFVCGCATTGASSSGADSKEGGAYTASTLPVTGKLRFSDVPAPVGFKLLQEQSFIFQTDNTRVALLKYSGRAKLPDLVAFYKEQMLLYNWELLNVVEYDKSILNFTRASETCIVTVESKGMKRIITISLAPRAKGSKGLEAQSK